MEIFIYILLGLLCLFGIIALGILIIFAHLGWQMAKGIEEWLKFR